MSPLPTVEVICGLLQQKELQKQVLEGLKFATEGAALISKGVDNRISEQGCTECGNKGHTREKCWLIIGYPPWHPRSKRSSPGSRRGTRNYRNVNTFRPRSDTSNWKGTEGTNWRGLAQVESQRPEVEHGSISCPTLTARQIE